MQPRQIKYARLLNKHVPVYSLPPEITSSIFMLGQATEMYDSHFSNGTTQSASFEILVSHVSSHFRETAINTPWLWRFIDISPTRSVEEITTYISRSNECGLHVRVRFEDEYPGAKEMAKLDGILSHWDRCHQLTINTVRGTLENPIIRHFSDRRAPTLQKLSILVEGVEGAINATSSPRALFREAPMLSFVRLRGLALPLFTPPLNIVTTLHLDQTAAFPIRYATFYQIITASPFLVNLSIYGDMISSPIWPGEPNSINLPNLRSLRLCGIAGAIYSGMLLAINAVDLESLILKDAHEFDLDRFWASPDIFKFPSLRHLTFSGFEFTSCVYGNIFRAFPGITKFSILYTAKTPSILHLLTKSSSEMYPWSGLDTLTILLDLDDDSIIREAIEARIFAGYPLRRLRLNTSHKLSVLRHYNWLLKHIILETFEEEDQWPFSGIYPDQDDVLFD